MTGTNGEVDTKGIDEGRSHPTLSELYPDVGRITLFVAFEEADSESEPKYQQIIFTAEADAAFRLDCPRDACVGGGFDFAQVVAGMVDSKESRVHGKLACAGHLGTGGESCSLHAEYRIVVD